MCFFFLLLGRIIVTINNCVVCIPELLDKKFILLHVNCHSHNSEQYYFPAEIAALEFNLRNGIDRTYHQMIGLCKYYIPVSGQTRYKICDYYPIIESPSSLASICLNSNELNLLIYLFV